MPTEPSARVSHRAEALSSYVCSDGRYPGLFASSGGGGAGGSRRFGGAGTGQERAGEPLVGATGERREMASGIGRHLAGEQLERTQRPLETRRTGRPADDVVDPVEEVFGEEGIDHLAGCPWWMSCEAKGSDGFGEVGRRSATRRGIDLRSELARRWRDRLRRTPIGKNRSGRKVPGWRRSRGTGLDERSESIRRAKRCSAPRRPATESRCPALGGGLGAGALEGAGLRDPVEQGRRAAGSSTSPVNGYGLWPGPIECGRPWRRRPLDPATGSVSGPRWSRHRGEPQGDRRQRS